MIERKVVDTIKSTLNCIDKARELGIELIKNGDNFRCSSFLHNGNNSSSVIIDKDRWFSFSDDIGGDIIDLVAYVKYNGMKGSAIKDLAKEIGININDNDVNNDEWKEYKNSLNSQIKFYHSKLTDEHREYLHKRNINDSTIDLLMIGYNSNMNRIIIPAYKNGYVSYFVGRTLEKISDSNPKYYKPYITGYSENDLFGLDTLDRSSELLIVAEGAFDYLSFHQEGYSVLSICGGTYSKEQTKSLLSICKRYKKVVLTFDRDLSGNKFTFKIAKQLFKMSKNFSIVNIPKPHKDISDCYSNGIPLIELIENATPGIEYFLNKYLDDYGTLFTMINEISPYLKKDFKIEIFKTMYKLEFDIDNDELKEFKKALYRCKTDLEMANEVKLYFNNHLKYNKNIGIFYFNGIYWEEILPEELRKLIRKICSLSLKSQATNSVLYTLYDEIITTELPNQRNCLNIKNGTLYFDEKDITKDGDFIDYKFNEFRNVDDFCTYVLDYDYNPKATSQELNEYFDKITFYDKKAQNLLFEFMGSVFLPNNPSQSAYLLYGNGSNGKSVYKKLISEMLGREKNCSNVGMDELSQPFSLINIMNKRVNFCNEAKSDVAGCETKFKQITGGDMIHACFKGKNYIDFIPRCKIFIDCNELPHARDLSDGWYRRFLPFEFTCKFTTDFSKVDEKNRVFHADKSLMDMVEEPYILTSALNLALKGYQLYVSKGMTFSEYDRGKEIIEEMRKEDNHVMLFFEDATWLSAVKENMGCVHCKTLYKIYNDWRDENGIVGKFNQNNFTKNFKKILDEKAIRYEHKDIRICGSKTKGLALDLDNLKYYFNESFSETNSEAISVTKNIRQ